MSARVTRRNSTAYLLTGVWVTVGQAPMVAVSMTKRYRTSELTTRS